MGLLDKLKDQGSNLTPYDGATPTPNLLSTTLSPMHNGYSINGGNFSLVNSAFQAYIDGTGNTLPSPSQLDLNGQSPNKYLDNLPG